MDCYHSNDYRSPYNLIIMKKIYFLVIFIFIAFATDAQTLPTLQKKSLRFSENMKTNDLLPNNAFQAYNKITGIFYMIANDDDNLYLIVRALIPDVITKIVGGGISFSIINKARKKEIDQDGISVTFPSYSSYGSFHFINMKNKPKPLKDTLINHMQVDSFMLSINHQLISLYKEIGVKGISSIQDSLISIYNEDGIKATAAFDAKVNYNYKLIIPLKYLKVSSNNFIKLYYQIKLNGATASNAEIRPNGKLLDIYHGNRTYYAMPATPQYMSIAYPTNFYGEYTLAGK